MHPALRQRIWKALQKKSESAYIFLLFTAHPFLENIAYIKSKYESEFDFKDI